MDDRNKRSQASWKQVEGSTTIRINLNLKGKMKLTRMQDKFRKKTE